MNHVFVQSEGFGVFSEIRALRRRRLGVGVRVQKMDVDISLSTDRRSDSFLARKQPLSLVRLSLSVWLPW